ncbi:MAG: hypothetical protein AABY22_35150 [Nanoarchaeota archaeon]
MKIKNIFRNASIIPEYLAKAASVPAGLLALGSEGGLVGKMISGYQKLYTLPMELFRNGSNLAQMAEDTDILTAREFFAKYGENAAHSTVNSIKGLADYAGQTIDNLSTQPISTVAAAGIAGLTLYVLGDLIGFCRTKGQGSALTRAKRSLGNKIWGAQ